MVGKKIKIKNVEDYDEVTEDEEYEIEDEYDDWYIIGNDISELCEILKEDCIISENTKEEDKKMDNMIILACKDWFNKEEGESRIDGIKKVISIYSGTETKYISKDSIFNFIDSIISKMNTKQLNRHIFDEVRRSDFFKSFNKEDDGENKLSSYLNALISFITIAKVKDIPDYDKEISESIIEEYNLRR